MKNESDNNNDSFKKRPQTYETDNKGYEKDTKSIEDVTKVVLQDLSKDTDPPSIGFFKLFSFSTKLDVLRIIIGLIASVGMGITWPLVILVFGGSTDSLANFQYYTQSLVQMLLKYNVTAPAGASITYLVAQIQIFNPSFQLDPKYDIMQVMMVLCQYYAALALGMFLLSYLAVSNLVISSQNQISVIRKSFFRAIMRQDMGWFDEQSSGALNNYLVDDINHIHAGIGDKFGQMIQWFSCGVAGLVLAFVKGWKLTLVSLSVSPLLGLTMFFLSMAMNRLNKTESNAYGKAGGIAEEVLGAIRTIVSFRGEKYEVTRYANNLDSACQAGTRKGLFTGILMGLFNGIMFGSYSLGFWYGATLIRSSELTVGSMIIIFFCCMMGSMGLGQSLPHFNTLNKSRASASKIYAIIDRIPEIDKMSTAGLRPESLTGDIEFKDVQFHYPTRPDCTVLRGLCLKVEHGQTIALVGSSGCGKSSIIQLIQRFYDSIGGEITIDGNHIKDLNVMWLREQIGVVSQEPILFACSIKENIRYGRLDVTDDDIDKALDMANAKKFVNELPNKLETVLGERGAQLSGGQKQRIAIARALVRNPKILLLDEATSALDSESERKVQKALDNARIGRTTVIVAHRLSTIRNADVIFGIKDGVAVESGNHDQLMALGGLYKDLVERQKIKKQDEDLEEDLDDSPVDPLEDALSVGDRRKSTTSSLDLEMKVEVKANQNYFFRVLRLNSPEACFIFFGCIGAILNGGSQPAFSVLFGYLLPAMANPNLEQQASDIQTYVIAMAGLAIVTFLANVIQSFNFSKSGEILTKRCRKLTFEAMLRQEMSWFDDADNNVGALTTRLSDEASAIRGLSGENIGMFCQALASMGAAVIISFVYTWQISLVILAFIPVLMIGGILRVKVMQGFSTSDKGALEDSGKIAVESIENIKTVSNLTREETFIKDYEVAISKLNQDVSKKSHLQALLFGITQATVFCAYAATFIMAGYLLKQGLVGMSNVFIAFGALIFGAMHLGNAIAMAPDYGKGKIAAKNMFGLLNRLPSIDSYSDEGIPINIIEAKGFLQLEKVSFRYPSRPKVKILKEIQMDIEPNTTVALVGQSGCGKSTIIQLLQRMYDINSGQLDMDNVSLKVLKVKDVREMFGLVSQEPILFAYSIRENIAYADSGQKYTTQQIEDAARAANIHDFIVSLPEKYETIVGEKGGNLSGGQKQRIAIARALLRNPRILLLDEATSALDTESEKIVQDALDKAQQGRTCIIIAHRLSTIQNATKILVFDNGRIAEMGTHQELIGQSGIYSNMIKMQTKQ